MIDNLDQVERLLVKLQQALPLPARMTSRLIATLRARAPLSHPHQSCQVKSVSYAGDEGGIVCHFEPEDGSSEVVVVSITHLDFDPHLPLAREIAAYQKHRLKRLRRLGP